MSQHPIPKRLATLAAAGGCVVALLGWSVGPVFIKYLSADFDAWTQNFFRYACACLLWSPVVWAGWRRGTVDRALWRRALLPAGANVIMQSCWAGAVYFINPAFMSLLSKSSLVWIMLMSFAAFPEERPLLRTWRFKVGLLVSVAGMLGVVLASRRIATEATVIGIALTLFEAVMWAVYVVAARRAFRHTDSRLAFAVNSVYTTIGLGLAAALFSRSWPALPTAPRPWVLVVVSGVVSIGISHTAYYAAMKRIGATVPALVVLGSPFVVLVISHFAFGETLTQGQWVWGLVLITGGVFSILAQAGAGDAAKETATAGG